MKLREIINHHLIITIDELVADVELIIELQEQLSAWGLYPGEALIDGCYGEQTELALQEFASLNQLDFLVSKQIDQLVVNLLLNPPTDILIATAINKEKLFNYFLDAEVNFSENNLRIRDSNIAHSPNYKLVEIYPYFLSQKPNNLDLISVEKVGYESYPDRGKLPIIDEHGLEFLHSDITEACVCLSTFIEGEIKTKWLGKNSLQPAQFWSATKFIPLLNIISQLNLAHPQADIDNCLVKSSSQFQGIPFIDLAIDVVSYGYHHGSSNSIAAMFKRFESYAGLDQWTSSITGNDNLTFQGRYGENEFYPEPLLYDTQLKQIVLQAKPSGERGQNLVSAYDLTRLITMLGWHYHLHNSARLPNAQWYSLATIIRAMGYDCSRYLDYAIARLGLAKVIKDPVIISKVGWGDSDERNRYEIVYTALIQFVDRRSPVPILRTFALTLRSAKAFSSRNLDQEAKELDARMATEVTDILRRIVTEEL
jgi:hypothetical protein